MGARVRALGISEVMKIRARGFYIILGDAAD